MGLGAKSLLVLTGLVMSMASYAERLPVDDAIDGLRAKADHLQQMKELLTKNNCVVHFGPHKYPLTAGMMRDNAIVAGISDSLPGQYIAWSQVPKPTLLRQVISMTHMKNINRALFISSSLKAKPGAETYTHLYVALGQVVMQNYGEKNKNYPEYEKVGFNISLEKVNSVMETSELPLKGGGGLKVTCNK